ncbi:MAG: M13 family metallopeptidase [Paludibacteraceae bacterium]|nr:M13 family metallopeptidase [Paludibacteraceae bacterium]
MKLKVITLMALTIMMAACNKQKTGIDMKNLDTSVNPQEDFYQYACGGWMERNPLTAEYSRFGSFDKLAENNRKQLNDLIEEIAKNKHPQGTIEQKIADIYNLALDTTRRNREGVEPIKPIISEIEAVNDRSSLSALLGKSMDYALWAMYVDADELNSSMNILKTYQAGFALGEKEYYFDNDTNTLKIRNAYIDHVEKMFRLFGYEDAAERSQVVLRLETRLAGAAKSNVELRDPMANYNKMSIQDLKNLVPQVDWDVFLSEMNIHTDSVSVGQIAHLQEAGKLLSEEPLEDIKTLLIWQTIDGAASYLSDDIYMQNFEFYGRQKSGRQEPSPLWKRAVSTVNSTLGEAVGQMYVQKYFPPEAKERMLQLVYHLQEALAERISNLDWMSDETKQKAQEKLAAFYIKIGYPDKWRDYTDLDIDPQLSFYENLKRAAKFEQEYSLSFLDKPVDRDKWYMTPQTVNAYYNPSTNEICFPAGILQYPFFSMEADDAFNYGAIGVVIGHEMTHGFDDQGAQFDKDGNLQNWWTQEDKEKFQARTKVMADFFDNIEVAPGVYGNGKLTLGENIADHGGLQVSFQAFKNATKDNPLPVRNGFTPEQRFFLAYANVWAGNIRDEEILNRTKSDPHSLGRWRVNGALPHINAWYEAWNITPQSPMYVEPEKRVSIW